MRRSETKNHLGNEHLPPAAEINLGGAGDEEGAFAGSRLSSAAAWPSRWVWNPPNLGDRGELLLLRGKKNLQTRGKVSELVK